MQPQKSNASSGQFNLDDPNSVANLVAKLVAFLLLIPALTTTVFLRHGLGYRIVRGRQIAASLFVMLMLAGMGTGVNLFLENRPSGPLLPWLLGAADSAASDSPTRAPRRLASEIAPNAGQLSSPETDPEAYKGVPRGYRWKRNPDGTWVRSETRANTYIMERIPAEPTIIPPIPDPQAEGAPATASGTPFVSPMSGATVLFYFALVFLPLAIFHNRRDWKRIITGVPGSTWNRGTPYLAAVLPFVRTDLVARFIEPALVMFLGMMAAYVGMPLLGGWVFLGGAFMAIFEAVARERYLAAFLDILDGEYFSAHLARDVNAVKGTGNQTAADAPASAEKQRYDGVVPTLPPNLAEKMLERQRLWQQQKAELRPEPLA